LGLSGDSAAVSVFGYVRCSTREQADSGLGLDAQREAIRQECVRRELFLDDVFVDEGFSGKDLRRPALSECLDELSRGDTLVVAKLDRLSRSLVDFSSLLERSQREGWSLVVLDSPVDTSTPAGEALVSVLATFAQFERRLIGQRTRDALAVRKRQGMRLGPPSTLTEADRKMIREMAESSGYAPTARWLNEFGPRPGSGGRQWWASTVRSVVKSA
jgi:DNA invertase Pin-like site-specific DNA recombinase